MRIAWEGGAVTDHELTLPKTRSHAATDPDTLVLVRRPAADYPDQQIAGIRARQRTAITDDDLKYVAERRPMSARHVFGFR